MFGHHVAEQRREFLVAYGHAILGMTGCSETLCEQIARPAVQIVLGLYKSLFLFEEVLQARYHLSDENVQRVQQFLVETGMTRTAMILGEGAKLMPSVFGSNPPPRKPAVKEQPVSIPQFLYTWERAFAIELCGLANAPADEKYNWDTCKERFAEALGWEAFKVESLRYGRTHLKKQDIEKLKKALNLHDAAVIERAVARGASTEANLQYLLPPTSYTKAMKKTPRGN